MYWRFFEYYFLVFVLILHYLCNNYIHFVKLPREVLLCTYQVKLGSIFKGVNL